MFAIEEQRTVMVRIQGRCVICGIVSLQPAAMEFVPSDAQHPQVAFDCPTCGTTRTLPVTVEVASKLTRAGVTTRQATPRTERHPESDAVSGDSQGPPITEAEIDQFRQKLDTENWADHLQADD